MKTACSQTGMMMFRINSKELDGVAGAQLVGTFRSLFHSGLFLRNDRHQVVALLGHSIGYSKALDTKANTDI